MADNRPRILPALIVFSDTTRAKPAFMLARFAALAASARPRAVLLVLRDYGLPVHERLELGSALRTLAQRHEQCFGVADRADVARALGACALHLPESGITEADARRYLGLDAFLSRACHEPLRAAECETDAVLLSPILEARKGRPALGLGALAQSRGPRDETKPSPALYALGGVDASNAAACVSAGAAGVAVIGAALAVDPLPLLNALKISGN